MYNAPLCLLLHCVCVCVGGYMYLCTGKNLLCNVWKFVIHYALYYIHYDDIQSTQHIVNPVAIEILNYFVCLLLNLLYILVLAVLA